MRKFENIRLTMRLLIIFLSLVTGMSSCTQNLDGYDWSIEHDSENPVIDSRVDDIKFKFCLLNKDSVPATVFKQGENFYFYFDIMNVSEELITVNEMDILMEEDVFMVYLAGTNVQAGKPWYTKGCRYVNIIGSMEIPVNNSYDIIIPWSFIFDLSITAFLL